MTLHICVCVCLCETVYDKPREAKVKGALEDWVMKRVRGKRGLVFVVALFAGLLALYSIVGVLAGFLFFVYKWIE